MEKKKDNVKNITITIEGEEWTTILDNTFKRVRKDLKVDGFRKGSITKEMYVKKFGIESLFKDAIDGAINVAYERALNETEVSPVCQPSVDIKSVDESKVEFEFTIITKPTVVLGKYKDLGVKKEPVKVSKEEIQEEIKALQDKYAEIVVKTNGEVVKGNTAVIDFIGKMDGVAFDGGTGENYPLEIGSNTFIPGFEDGVIGMKVGETKDLELKFPEEYTEELKGKDVVFTVTVRELKERLLPEINEDFFADLGYEDVKTVEDFEKKVKEDIKHRKEHHVEDKYVDEVLRTAVDNMKVDVNEEIIHDEIHRMLHQYEEQLSMQGITLEQYLQFTNSTRADLEKMMAPEAEAHVKTRYLLEAVADAENIEVSDEEAKAEAKKVAEMYQVTEEDFINMIGGLEVMKYDCKMKKAMEFLKEN